ncbi:MinD/ParA family ATP-binding protein [Brachybacterium sp. J153]|uniref:MinD/ParA family ATP-binding protein n=1 Tax=Brachybacterium sp. J153 TaxID=3116488 RepID=UPI002E779661|nr:AAA family ATPase [Brachybacterium sp. J153]MEE1619730.1 AAA family ATPase [Brachybacterium sp. J153]
MTSAPTPSTWPHVAATLNPDGTAQLTISGSTTPIAGRSVDDARGQVLARITATAAKLNRPVRAEVTDPEGEWTLLVHPDGGVEEDPTVPRKRSRATRAATPVAQQPEQAAPAPAPRSPLAPAPAESAPVWKQDQSDPAADEPTWTPQPEPTEVPEPAVQRPAPAPEDPEWTARAALPAEEGARGRFNRVLGTKIAPSPAELAHRRATLEKEREQRAREQADAEAAAADEGRRAARERAAAEAFRQLRAIIQTNFQRTRTILVANPKGGARKTTTAALLAAVLGIFRGGYVAAWDANETMGTLGSRSLTGTHTRTVVDLLEAAAQLDSIRVGDLDAYVRPQGDSHFDVLASDEDPTRQDMVDADGFATIHDILERFYRLIVVDTGNNIRASHFRAALDAADQLVIPVAASYDSAEAAEKMMRSFRASGHDQLVDEAVVLIHDLEPENGDPAYFDVARSIAERFEQQVTAVLPIPFDPALKDGGQIDYAQLTDKTQRAYQEAAGAVARNLAAQLKAMA